MECDWSLQYKRKGRPHFDIPLFVDCLVCLVYQWIHIFYSTAVVRITLRWGEVWERRWYALEQHIKFNKHNYVGAYQEHSCLPPHFQSMLKQTTRPQQVRQKTMKFCGYIQHLSVSGTGWMLSRLQKGLARGDKRLNPLSQHDGSEHLPCTHSPLTLIGMLLIPK